MSKKNEINDTKRQILNTAQELFVKYSYSSVSMNDIAQKLNLSKPALYHHFKNKEELYITILRLTHKQYINSTKKIIADPDLDLKEKFQKVIDTFLRQHSKSCKNKSMCSSMILMQKMSKYHGDIMDFMKEARSEAMETVQPLIKDILKKYNLPKEYDPKLMFLLVSGAMNGYIIDRHFLESKNWSTKEVVDHLTLLVFKDK